jgi:hypothetical protein
MHNASGCKTELHLMEVFEQYIFRNLFTFETITIAANIDPRRMTILYSDGMVKNIMVNPIAVMIPEVISRFFTLSFPNL